MVTYEDIQRWEREQAKLQKIRSRIDEFVNRRDWNGLVTIRGIKIVEQRALDKDERDENNCFQYVEDQTGVACDAMWSEWYMFPGRPRQLVSVDRPQKGDIVAYSDPSRTWEYLPRHVGVYVGRGKVRSKWGLRHVFEHGVNQVPTRYGFDVDFYRKTATVSPVEQSPQLSGRRSL